MLAHTKDDQAETVLLRLTRGSGTRSLAAMRSVSLVRDGLPFWRPLLHIDRAVLRESLLHYNLTPYEDPHNQDQQFLRVVVRNQVMPMLKEKLGAGIVNSLARTAELAQSDSDALDRLAQVAYVAARVDNDLSIVALANEEHAISTRAIRLWLLELQVPGAALDFNALVRLQRLVRESDQVGPISLPGVDVVKESGRLRALRRNDGSG